MITCHESYIGNKKKKTYTVTQEGRQLFKEWMISPIEDIQSYEQILGKVFFFRYMEEHEIITILTNIIENLNRKIDDYNQVKSNIFEVAERHEYSTFSYGLDYLVFTRNWYQNYLSEYRASLVSQD